MLNVGCKLSDRNFGAKVSVCFPRGDGYDGYAAALKRVLSRHADRIEALLLSGELEAVFEGGRVATDKDTGFRLGGRNDVDGLRGKPGATEGAPLPDRAAAGANPPVSAMPESSGRTSNTDRLVPEGWPASGTVTLAEICGAWGVSKSTYKRRMDAGKYPEPLEDVGTIAKRYSAPDVRDAFVAEMLALHERAAVRDGGME